MCAAVSASEALLAELRSFYEQQKEEEEDGAGVMTRSKTRDQHNSQVHCVAPAGCSNRDDAYGWRTRDTIC